MVNIHIQKFDGNQASHVCRASFVWLISWFQSTALAQVNAISFGDV